MTLYAEIQARLTGRLAMAPEEAGLLAETVAGSQVHIEIGCLWGGTAILAALAGARQVYSIDPMSGGWWQAGADPAVAGAALTPYAVLENLARFDLAGRVQVVRASSKPWPLLALEADTILIDGDHSFEGCRSDWEVAVKLARRAILVHDVDDAHPDVTRMVQECAARTPGRTLTERRGALALFRRLPSPLVSVIVPTYNRPELLARALESIAEQAFTDLEILVVNDGGLSVAKLVARFPQARHFRHPANRGLPAARNTALAQARGHYIAYLDDDDWYYRSHLETLVRGLGGARAGYSDAHEVSREQPRRVYCSRDYSREALHQHNLFPVCCVLHEKSLLDQAGGFDESLANHEDWDLWLRMAAHADFRHLPVVTCAIDRTRSTMNSDRPAMLAGFNLVRERYREGARA
jgi:hypothetical protein